MKAGDSKTFPLTFPADYHGKEVAGKTRDFVVTVKKVEPSRCCRRSTSAFAKAFGIPSGSVDGPARRREPEPRARIEVPRGSAC